MIAYRVRREFQTGTETLRVGTLLDPEVVAGFPQKNRDSLIAAKFIEYVDVDEATAPDPTDKPAGSAKGKRK